MYATDGLADVLGITGDELHGKSFYFCMQQQCLRDAVHCLENAKANDSIAYLRFWYQDPRLVEVGEEFQLPTETDGSSETSESASGSPQSEESTARLLNAAANAPGSGAPGNPTAFAPPSLGPPGLTAASSSGAESNSYVNDLLPGQLPQHSTGSTTSETPRRRPSQPIQLEAVISCTSDGLVVCLRVAAPAPEGQLVPTTIHPNFTPYSGEPQEYVTHYEPVNGAFPPSAYTRGLRGTYGPPQAVPTRQEPALPQARQGHGGQGHLGYSGPQTIQPQSLYAVPWGTQPMLPPNYTPATAAAPGASSNQPSTQHSNHTRPNNRQQDFMASIREMAVFAWALVGINGSLAEHGNGKPHGEAQPPSGAEVWRPDSRIGTTSNLATSAVYLQDPAPSFGNGGRDTAQVDGRIPLGGGKPRHSSGVMQHDSAIDSNFDAPGRRAMVDGNMTDGDGTSSSTYQTLGSEYRTLPGFEAFKQGNHSPHATFRDKDSAMGDGVDSPPHDGNVRGSTSSSDRTPGTQVTNQWGFGDPGLRSRASGLYNPALQNLSPTGTLQGDHEIK